MLTTKLMPYLKPESKSAKIVLFLLVFLLSFMLALTYGASSSTPLQVIVAFLSEGPIDTTTHDILFNIRLPRILCGCAVGAGLSAAGLLCQSMFRNTLASPSVLGVSSGGLFAAVLVLYLGFDNSMPYARPFAAIIGSLLAMLVLLKISRISGTMSTDDLLLVGLALSGIFASLSSFVLSLSLQEVGRGAEITNWMLGTLNGKGWQELGLISLPILFGLIYCYRSCYRLDIMSMGEDFAVSSGIDTGKLRLRLILFISLLVGTSVAIGGLFPFVSLLIPYFSRQAVGPRHSITLSAAILNGMTLVVLADLLARILMRPLEIQVGVIISLIGSPFFLWMLVQRKREVGS